MYNGNYTVTLKQPGFFAFFCTQFLGAFNDNFLKIVVSFVALSLAGHGGDFYVELIAILFILPSALFSGYAGHLADVYSKRTILVAVKAVEIAIMIFVLASFYFADIRPMLAAVFFMGLHSAFFSPAKYGILPEMLPDKELSRGNGLLEMSTFMAIILGTSVGSAIFSVWKKPVAAHRPDHDRHRHHRLCLPACASPKVPASGSAKLLNLNPFGEIIDGLRRLRRERALWFTVLGISYFWFLGALVNINILFFGKELLQLDEFHIGLLGTFLAIGIGIGQSRRRQTLRRPYRIGLGTPRLGRHGRLPCPGRLGGAVVSAHRTGLDAARLCRRPVRRAAQRAIATAQRQRGKGPTDRDQ